MFAVYKKISSTLSVSCLLYIRDDSFAGIFSNEIADSSAQSARVQLSRSVHRHLYNSHPVQSLSSLIRSRHRVLSVRDT